MVHNPASALAARRGCGYGRAMTRSFDEARSPRTADAVPVPRQAGRADRLLALQRSAGNAAVGALLRRERQTLARCAGGACHCGKCSQDEELEIELHGKR
jgi:hypothetical protein